MKMIFMLIVLSTNLVFSQYEHIYSGSSILKNEKNPKIMTLGTFHFGYPGNDGHKTEKDKRVNVLSEVRQKEITKLVDALKLYKPTKILIEWKNQRVTDSLYQEYLEGKHRDRRNEVYQISFRLAMELGHKQVYCADVNGRSYKVSDERINELEKSYKLWKKRNSKELLSKNWDARYSKHYKAGDDYRLIHSIYNVFQRMNHPQSIREMHGHYLVSSFDFEEKEFSYTGVDGFVTMWYNRNLKIFRNIKRYTENSDDRLLLVIGAGHIPIINHAIDNSPDYEFVSPLVYLK